MSRLKYKPIKKNETVDISVTLSQAAALLDHAADKALAENNADLMLAVADRWLNIASLFTQEEEKDCIDMNKSRFGFCPGEEGEENE